MIDSIAGTEDTLVVWTDSSNIGGITGMDKQQAYLELVEQLLNCPQGQEAELLQAHGDLVDAGLLATMEQVAAYLESQGNGNAQWLRGFAAQLAEALGLGTSTPQGTEAARQFLLETLQLIVDRQRDPKQIYPLWAQQQAQFNPDLLAVLPTIATQLLSGDAERQWFIAAVFVEFGDLLQHFPLGERWLNLEIAITAYEQALQVMTREAMPVEWAQTMNNLANAYSDRIRGDKAQNIEDAITAYEQALQVTTREAMPVEWAASMNNLATAYADRIRGERAQNIEDAITAYEQSLQVRTREAMPVEWAESMMNLAIAYRNRIRGDRAQNIEDAITAYEQSLQVTTREAMPVEWAESMMNLATAYRNRIRGERAQNIEDAITACEQALQVMTREAMPVEWATLMNNLAIAYRNRIRGERAQNIEDAIAAYRDSLEIFTPDLLPDYCRRTARALGNLYSREQQWEEAVPVYRKALQAAETLYQSANLLDSRAAEITATADLPRRAGYALARNGDLQTAVETLEQGRARGLSESLDRDRADLTQLQQSHPNLYQTYQDITAQLRNLESQQRERMTAADRQSLTPTALRDAAVTLRQQLTDTLQQIRQVPGYDQFLSLPTFADVQAAATEHRPLVYLVTTPAGSLALVVTPDTIESLWLDTFNETQLIDLLRDNWFTAYKAWITAIRNFNQNQSEENTQTLQQATADWYAAIDTVTRQLWEPLLAPLIAHLHQQSCHTATLIATGYLSLLPLHTAWTENTSTPTGRRYALDEIHFTYAPNARSLTAAGAIAQRSQADSILAIDNPRQDLPNSAQEVTAAIATFPQSTVLPHDQATVAAVKSALLTATVAHFACHGTANLNDPLNSGLLMSDALLTLRDLFALNLADQGGLRLALLSACETGLSGIENADEAISLPTGLLQAGVAAVIASLWSVSDLSTMMLLTRFYDFWRTDGLPPDQALRQAQQWLRDTTNDEKTQYFEKDIPALSGTRMPQQTAELLYQSLGFRDPDARDFAPPFHWAAFSYTGA